MKTKSLIYAAVILFVFTFGVHSEASICRHFEQPVMEKDDPEILQVSRDLLFRFNPELRHQVRLQAEQGIISLYGIVDTLKDQEEAVDLLKTVEGVRGVIDYSILKPVVRSDQSIKSELFASFSRDPFFDDVEIKVSQAVVTLSGFVANYLERQAAVKRARGIRGVLSVRDHLSVDSQKERSERELEDEIMDMFSRDSYLFDNNITARIYNGQVILQGSVDTDLEKSYAADTVAALGIGPIDNQLRTEGLMLGYTQKRNLGLGSSQIRQAMKDLIRLDERITTKNVALSVDDGVITFRGEVCDSYQKKLIEQEAHHVPGVRFVKNALIAQKISRSDEDIVRDIRRVFRQNLAGISVSCERGKVTLSGPIDSLLKKNLAEGMATRIAGVSGVLNQLQLKDSEIKQAKSTTGHGSSRRIKWNLEVEDKTFQVYVNQMNETIVIRGEAENWDQKHKAEHVLELRAPGNFQIINEIEIRNG